MLSVFVKSELRRMRLCVRRALRALQGYCSFPDSPSWVYGYCTHPATVCSLGLLAVLAAAAARCQLGVPVLGGDAPWVRGRRDLVAALLGRHERPDGTVMPLSVHRLSSLSLLSSADYRIPCNLILCSLIHSSSEQLYTVLHSYSTPLA